MGMTSLWAATSTLPHRAALTGRIQVEVIVVGAGIVGLTTALILAQQGRSVAVIDAHRIGRGATGGSTGNLYATVADGLAALVKKWDAQTARAVVASRTEAIAWIEQQTTVRHSDCAFRRCPMFQYAISEQAEGRLQDELDAARLAGMAVDWTDHVPKPLPVPYGRVLVLPGQAQFHPLRYMHALAAHAEQCGVQVYEHSPAMELDAGSGVVRTPAGRLVGRHIVLATHTPIGFHFIQAGMQVRREYGLAFRLGGDVLAPGIFWALGMPRLSVRSFETDGQRYLLCIGEHHETGRHDAAAALARLIAEAQTALQLGEPAWRWSAQHYHSPDELPYIGQDSAGFYVATGFSTDGLVYGTLAGRLIADQINGRENRWSELYRVRRFHPGRAGSDMFKANTGVAKEFFHDYVTYRSAKPAQALAPGQGAIVRLGHERVAAYRDAAGALHVVSAVCTHMKCMVHWNAVERSWDCPCHGSRYSPDGQVLEGPALSPLRNQLVLLQNHEVGECHTTETASNDTRGRPAMSARQSDDEGARRNASDAASDRDSQ
ncbi:FAD-dependent oxidoreductase (plasmid) [Cupriavidus sp. P-10]|uniref:FAD-dependent oxidoreductase n=2 Tax=Burkholderiaceae TaxID=119060 RepID=UPI000B0C65CA|nr:FAD-dependent oxidoreductase [Cupriavidus sp. P-10]BDB30522.1 FAD-dependent oxidoreductase [Cupriavidus sp. P-10]